MTQLIVSNEKNIFKRTFLKENNISHSILQYSSTLFAELLVELLQGFEKVSILLTYRSNVQHFIGQINHLVTFHKPDLGDFNINALRDSPLLDTMRHYGYTLLETEKTHIMGGLLDHVYIRNNANVFGKVTLQTQLVYYSDHDGIILN